MTGDATLPAGGPDVRVRPAVPTDADAIGEVHVEAWRAAYRGQLPDTLLDGLSIDDRRAAWRRRLEEPARAVWVAIVGGRIVGFAASGPAGDEDLDPSTVTELRALYLLPAQWGRGVGFALHGAVLASARAEARETLALWVLRSNARGRAFYERQGWRPDGVEHRKPFRDVLLDEVRYLRSV